MRPVHFLLLWVVAVLFTKSLASWVSTTTTTIRQRPHHHHLPPLYASSSLPEKVQVCGFKDCKSRGGGPRLQTLVKQVVDERGWPMVVEACDCQGECGYGPNLVVDGRLVNGVQRNVDSILQALGVVVPEEEGRDEEEAATTTAATATITTTTTNSNVEA
jgi:hypothetical protein